MKKKKKRQKAEKFGKGEWSQKGTRGRCSVHLKCSGTWGRESAVCHLGHPSLVTPVQSLYAVWRG